MGDIQVNVVRVNVWKMLCCNCENKKMSKREVFFY